MSALKYFLALGIALFVGVGLVGYFKRLPTLKRQDVAEVQVIQEVAMPIVAAEISPSLLPSSVPMPAIVEEQVVVDTESTPLPEVDWIGKLFTTDTTKLPIVETVSYTSRVPWIEGRPAWIADYASHYKTSRHFIARSLNKKPDYFTQKISLGERFNVFKKDLNLQFYLLADVSRCKMWLYYVDLDKNERVLLKSYPIGVGRSDPKTPSGSLTPIGKYTLGDKIAIYKPGIMGYFQDAQVEMVRIFGTRWIPFDEEVAGCSEPAKGFGLHGAPWVENAKTLELVEDRAKIGKYEGDGCIRLNSEDIEEIFAIIITKPTVIELVKDFHDAKLPGVEKQL